MTDGTSARTSDAALAPIVRSRWFVVAAFGLLVLSLYFVNLNSFFVGDDYDFLRRVGLLDSVFEAATFEFAGGWSSLTYVSWYIDQMFWGINPTGFHLTNLAWLTLLCLGIYGLIRSILPGSTWAAWCGGLLFATHPLHDEAISYRSARAHTIGAALSILALMLYTRFRPPRRAEGAGKPKLWYAAAALLVAFLAMLAKETSMTLAAWIFVYEWLIVQRERSRLRALGQACVAGGLFVLPAVGYFFVRAAAVGLDSDKLEAAGGGTKDLLGAVLRDSPLWALWAGLPVPFGSADRVTLEAWSPLGWMLLLLAFSFGLFAAYRCWSSRTEHCLPLGLVVLGLTITVVTLAPVFWADLYLRRRYFLTPSIGVVLMLAGCVPWLEARSPRVLRGAVLALALAGGWVLVQHNATYRDSGEVARRILLDIDAEARGQQIARIDLITLPRAFGGDAISGAYLLQHSDLKSAVELMGLGVPRLSHSLTCYHCDDYDATLTLSNARTGHLAVQFESQAAYDWNATADISDGERGKGPTATLHRKDPQTRTLYYDLLFPKQYWLNPRRQLYLYDNQKMIRVRPQDFLRPVGS